MSMEEFPALHALFSDLRRMDARESVRDAIDHKSMMAEGKDVTRVAAPWLGETYLFSGPQREVVRQLILALTGSRSPDIDERELLRRSKARCNRLSELFEDHPAWGVLIIKGERHGSYRLAGPDGD